MPTIQQAANRFRTQVLLGDRQVASALVAAYGEAYRGIQADLAALQQQIADARGRGETVGVAWLLRQERLQTLQAQAAHQIALFSHYADQQIVTAQNGAVVAGEQAARDLMVSALGGLPPGVTLLFNRMPVAAVRELVGVLQDGSPLRSLLDELGPAASAAIRTALIRGVATGQSPREIARQIRQALGGNLTRALTIARTETLRAYRGASLETYRANRDVVQGWQWDAELGPTCCALCVSMHGTIHELDEDMATHANCRCSMVPLTVSWADLGYADGPDPAEPLQSGIDWFEQAATAVQRAILGPAKLARYQAGELSLEDVRGVRNDPRWGRVGYERSLREIDAA